MNVGKTLFAQVMELVPWKTFGRIIERHKGRCGVRTLGCADLFRILGLLSAHLARVIAPTSRYVSKLTRASCFIWALPSRRPVPPWPMR